LLVLFRPKKDAAKERSETRGKGMREVTIVKPSPSGTKRPTVSKVMLNGQRRVPPALDQTRQAASEECEEIATG